MATKKAPAKKAPAKKAPAKKAAVKTLTRSKMTAVDDDDDDGSRDGAPIVRGGPQR